MITTLVMQSTDVLAQIDTNLTPQAPTGSGGFVMIARIIMWCVLFAGIVAVVVGGGWLAWEKFNGGLNNAPKVIIAAFIGGIVAVSASGLMNMVISAAQS
ncbi:hypothetical protein ACFYTQ_35415 [Nocardia sp. NPDC004068]|uniref:hypothetical protein n=1 Tax=Nocardia sp. NPDC004068 TaxID=3364303 RepID=UPI0036B3B6C0